MLLQNANYDIKRAERGNRLYRLVGQICAKNRSLDHPTVRGSVHQAAPEDPRMNRSRQSPLKSGRNHPHWNIFRVTNERPIPSFAERL